MLIPLSEEWDVGLRSGDPLDWPGYRDKLATLDGESVRTGIAELRGARVAVIEGDFSVIGGSMGIVHGEKVVRAFDRAVEARLPVLVVTRSGGARMQEGMASLIQMARTAAAVERHRAAGLLSVTVHRSPTTGGVFASYGSLTDIRIAETGATIGFAGPRVVEQTSGESVEGLSHTAETAFAAGLVDQLVGTDDLVERVEAALGVAGSPLPRRRLARAADDGDPGSGAWASVVAARAADRPSGIDVATELTTSWTEIGGGIDPTIRCGLADLAPGADGQGPAVRAMVIASDRHAGDGRPVPAGFRLARRAMALAGQLGIPLVALVDTPGADPRPAAENDGVAGEIARCFAAMATVPVPTVAACVGEGGSGGALAIAGADRLLMQETAIFSVIAPEGAAAILERDAAKAPDVSERLRLTSADMMALGIADAVVADDAALAAAAVRSAVDDLTGPGSADVGSNRHRRFDRATRRHLVDLGPDGFVAP